MRAIHIREFGDPSAIVVSDIDAPGEPGPNEVRLDVAGVGVGYFDGLLIRGDYQIRPDLPFVPGSSMAGTVAAVGEGVTHLQAGTPVAAFALHGGMAEQVVLPAASCAPLPEDVDLAAAANFFIAWATGLYGLREIGRVRSGETVLVLGAAGTTGTAAIECAKALGVEVIAAASTEEKREHCRKHSADHVVDYTQEDVTSGDRQFDLIVDTAGSHSLREWGRVLGQSGRYVMVGGPTRRFVIAMALGPVLSALGDRRYGGFTLTPDPDDLRLLGTLLDAGDITPVIDREYSLRQVPDAVRYLEAGRATGKVVVRSA